MVGGAGLHGIKKDGIDSVDGLFDGVDWGTDQSSKAPDLVVGYGSGYRGSWQTAIGGVPAGDVITDNVKKWSGDHCCDGALVPGVFFCNRADLAPTEHVQDIVRWIGDARRTEVFPPCFRSKEGQDE